MKEYSRLGYIRMEFIMKAIKTIILSASLFTTQHGLAAADENSLQPSFGWRESIAVSQKLEFDPVRMQLYGFALRSKNDMGGPCDSLLLAEYLISLAANALGTSYDNRVLSEDFPCEIEGSVIWTNLGIAAFEQKNFEDAAAYFKQAFDAAQHESKPAIQYTGQNLGSTFIHLMEYKSALETFQAAYDANPKIQNPTHSNNLAYANYLIGNSEESLKWTKLSRAELSRLKSENPFIATQFESEWNASLITDLLTALYLEDEEIAKIAIDQMNFQGTFEGREAIAVSALTMWAQWKNDFDWFKNLHGFFENLLLEVPTADRYSVMGLNAQLFAEEDIERIWAEVRLVPIEMRGGFRPFQDSGYQILTTSREVFPADLFSIIALLVLAGSSAWLLIEWTRQRQWSELSNRGSKVLQAEVEEALSGGSQQRGLIAFEALLRQERMHQLSKRDVFAEFSDLERSVALGLAAGEHTKSIAMRLNLSLSAIYKIRSQLRNRLGLHSNESLDRWLRSD